MDHSFTELWFHMGPFAKGIVFLLAAMSLASLATAVERMLAIRSARRELVERLVPDWQAVLSAPMSSEERREAFDRTIRQSLISTGDSLRRGLGVLATVGSTAPFVGLVGTVAGIINAFEELAHSQQAGIGMVSAGIAEALVTTAFGIGVAIPAVWLFNYLTTRISGALTELECRAQGLAVSALRREAR